MFGLLGLSRVPPGGRAPLLPVLRGLASEARIVLDDGDSHVTPSCNLRGRRLGGLSAIQTSERLLSLSHHATGAASCAELRNPSRSLFCRVGQPVGMRIEGYVGLWCVDRPVVLEPHLA